MKLMPASSAACSIPCLSSMCPHQSLARVHVPNPTSETSSSLLPKRRYRKGLLELAVLDDGAGDLAVAHDVERLVDLFELDLLGDELVEEERALGVELGEHRHVAVDVRAA